MKIENSGVVPPSSQSIEGLKRAEKKEKPKESQSVHAGQDTVEMSEEGRLLAKAHAALADADQSDTKRLEALRQQIQSGDYSVQVAELARKILARFGPQKAE